MSIVEGSPALNDERRTAKRSPRTALLGGSVALSAALLAACGSGNGNHLNNAGDTAAASSPNSNGNIPTVHVTTGAGPKVLITGSRHKEIQQFGAPTFADYQGPSGPGPFLPKGAVVFVDCYASAPANTDPSAVNQKTGKAEYYHMTDPSSVAGYYTPADNFENGDTSGPLSSQPARDPKVPACPQG